MNEATARKYGYIRVGDVYYSCYKGADGYYYHAIAMVDEDDEVVLTDAEFDEIIKLCEEAAKEQEGGSGQ